MSSHTRFSTLARAVAEGAASLGPAGRTPPRARSTSLQRLGLPGPAAPRRFRRLRRHFQRRRGRTPGLLAGTGRGGGAARNDGAIDPAIRDAWTNWAHPRPAPGAGTGRSWCRSPESGPTAFLIVVGTGARAAGAIAGRRIAARTEFGLALELARLGREASLHREIQELLLRFSRGISSTLSVAGALASLSIETNALFGTERASVWLHDRRTASSICSAVVDGRWPGRHAACRPTRTRTRPAVSGWGVRRSPTRRRGRVLVAPLRGWRRALGTLVIEGDPGRLRRTAIRRQRPRARRQLSVCDRERAAARRIPAAAAAARGHVQLARRPRRRRRSRHFRSSR